MSQKSSSEYEELAINTVAGLSAFLKNINEVYRSGLAVEHFDTSVLATGFTTAYATLRTNIEMLIQKRDTGESVTVADAEFLQRTYNTFVTQHNSLLQEDVSEVVTAPTVMPFEIEESPVVTETVQQEPVRHAPVQAEQIIATPPVAEPVKEKQVNDIESNERQSKKMVVEDTDAEMMIPITSLSSQSVTKKKRRRKKKKTTEGNSGENVQHKVSFVPVSIASQLHNPVQRSVPKQLMNLPRADSIHEKVSLTEKYLTAPKYRTFIAEHFSSPAGFERIIDATITKIEAETIDHLEKWLGETHASAFDYLKDGTIDEFLEFSQHSFDEIKTVLQKENIKYETFATWQDILSVMLTTMKPPGSVTFGEVFARFMIEQEMKEITKE